MLNRKIDNEIDVHFSNSKKALFLTGARQVGKTYSIRKYAKQHGLNLIEFNFLLQPETMDIIIGAGDVKELLLRISAYSRVPLVRSRPLIFLDEVQECPDVMTWVKALVDEGSYIYALSGSLLGVELKDIRSVLLVICQRCRSIPWILRNLSEPWGCRKMCWKLSRSLGRRKHRWMPIYMKR